MSSYVTLNNGLKAPAIGLGLWKIAQSDAQSQVYNAIKLGYRLFDGAEDYGNEKQVGLGIKQAIDEGLVKREDLFIVSKLWNTYHHPNNVKKALNKTLSDLGLDYVDLFYIHFPISQKFIPIEDLYPPGFGYPEKGFEFENVPIRDTYKALENLVDEGFIRSLGISNFQGSLLYDLLRDVRIKPVALQIEHHPYLVQKNLIEFAQKENIWVVAYSSFGPQSFIELNHKVAQGTAQLFDNSTIKSIASKHGKTSSQVLLRWANQRGLGIIPKSSNKERLLENLKIEDFELSTNEIELITGLDQNLRFNDPWYWTGYSGIPIFA